ncbi:Spy/CpxP family protein refolding chaperone [Telmatobacter bradus]|uniref:Spy/CpxP family protein refolding chaperone n=1 Tax=Telmatobacter bradus TaxID=474953 RepID=UPI003B42B93C
MTLSRQLVRRMLCGRMLILAALLILTGAPLFAQDGGQGGPPPGGGPPDGMDGGSQQQRGPSIDRQLKQLTKQLSLTPDQQTNVKAILTEQHQKMSDLMQSMRPAGGQASSDDSQRPDPEQFEKMRTAMKALRNESNAKIAALLTESQLAKFNALLKQQSQRDNQDGPPGPPPDGGEGGPPDGGGGPGGGGPPMM